MGRVRHRRLLERALADAEGGAQALPKSISATCVGVLVCTHRYGQALRVGNVGPRRYVDVEMRTWRGRRLVVEIDGAVHLIVGNYWSDMARANELVIAGQSVLRFPTVALYLNEALVADQVRRTVND